MRRRPKNCSKKIRSLRFTNLEGGIAAWKRAGLPTASLSDRYFLPLEQQVQLTIGLCVLAGSVLGYYVSPAFFLSSGFFGLGLIFAGLTGFCGFALFMARMPWNRTQMPGSMCKP